MLETYLFLTFDTAGLTHALKGVSLRPPICHVVFFVKKMNIDRSRRAREPGPRSFAEL